MRSALPRIPIAGTADAGGNLTIQGLAAPHSFYAALYIAIQSSAGSPTYAIQQGSAAPLVFGGGAQTQLGPILLNPGETFDVVVKGAMAGAVITGQGIGWQAEEVEELPPVMVQQGSVYVQAGSVSIIGSPAVTVTSGTVVLGAGAASIGTVVIGSGTVNIGNTPSVIVSSGTINIGNTPAVTISGTVNATITSGSVTITAGTVNVGNTVQVASNQVLLGAYTVVGPTGSKNQVYTLPAGTHGICVNLNIVAVGGAQLTSLQVLGVQSGTFYYDSGTSQTALTNATRTNQYFVVSSAMDTQITVNTLTSAGTVTVIVTTIAILDTMIVVPQSIGYNAVALIGGMGSAGALNQAVPYSGVYPGGGAIGSIHALDVNLPAVVTFAPHTNVAASIAAVQLLWPNTTRKRVSIFNDSTAVMYLDDASALAASTTNYTTQIPPLGLWESPIPCNTHAMSAVWATAVGTARVTEYQ